VPAKEAQLSTSIARSGHGLAKVRRFALELIGGAILRASGAAVLIVVAASVYFVLSRGAPTMTWKFLTTMPRNGMTEGGILSPIVGTVMLVCGTMIVAMPLGMLSAIYLSEYARPGPFTRLVRLAIVNLAGVPSVVYGLFGVALFVNLLRCHESVVAGSLTLALLILPLVIVASEEALSSVPQSFREASLALGATKWQTVRRVVLPNAIPGIITGGVLAVGRAAGETAPIMFTAATYYMPNLPRSIFDKVMALPYHLYVLSTEVSHAPVGIQWGTALTLVGMVLGLNLIASSIRVVYRRRQTW
jgi:phosphate transport system permease protein